MSATAKRRHDGVERKIACAPRGEVKSESKVAFLSRGKPPVSLKISQSTTAIEMNIDFLSALLVRNKVDDLSLVAHDVELPDNFTLAAASRQFGK